MPPYQTVTIFHLRDLASGKRTRISCDDVRVYQIPQYEGLTTEDILNFSKRYPEVALALPIIDREVKKLPREYISNLVHTVVKKPFVTWVLE